MKKFKFLGIAVLLTAIMFSFAACKSESDDPDPFMQMVSITGGTFTMGNDAGDLREKPAFLAKINNFYIGKYLVTQEQYEEVMGTNPSNFQGALTPSGVTEPGKLPVEKVSWYDAIVFCNKLSLKEGYTPVYNKGGSTDTTTWGTIDGTNTEWQDITFSSTANGYRLPTSAEWEFACRAGTTSTYYNGESKDNMIAAAHVDNKTTTIEVGKKPANPWGLYDMIGNVGEWCWDWVDSTKYSSPETEYTYYRENKNSEPANNPAGIAKPGVASSSLRKIWRGAAYNTNTSNANQGRRLESAYHERMDPALTGADVGFRVVRNR